MREEQNVLMRLFTLEMDTKMQNPYARSKASNKSIVSLKKLKQGVAESLLPAELMPRQQLTTESTLNVAENSHIHLETRKIVEFNVH